MSDAKENGPHAKLACPTSIKLARRFFVWPTKEPRLSSPPKIPFSLIPSPLSLVSSLPCWTPKGSAHWSPPDAGGCRTGAAAPQSTPPPPARVQARGSLAPPQAAHPDAGSRPGHAARGHVARRPGRGTRRAQAQARQHPSPELR